MKKIFLILGLLFVTNISFCENDITPGDTIVIKADGTKIIYKGKNIQQNNSQTVVTIIQTTPTVMTAPVIYTYPTYRYYTPYYCYPYYRTFYRPYYWHHRHWRHHYCW